MSSASLLQQLVNKVVKLGDRLHLNREQAYSNLETQIIPQILRDSAGEHADLEAHARQMLIDITKVMFNSSRWEDRFGAINGSTLLIQNFYPEQAGEEKPLVDSALRDYVWNTIRIEKIGPLLTDSEFRVRNQVGPLLKAMILKDRAKGAKHFENLQKQVLQNIEETFLREPEGGVDASADVSKVTKQINTDETGKTMHDTEGWKSLETSMRILQNIVEAIGNRLYDFDLERLLKCIEKGVDHINRFVREISYFLINAVFLASATILEAQIGEEAVDPKHEAAFRAFCKSLVPIVGQGLADNWSQVRYVASQAVRSYYAIVKDDKPLRESFDGLLIPRMCLNRYYVAEGVKIYSQETWKSMFGEGGRQLVCTYASEICQYYILQSQADNHAVREAACHCISELCTKVASTIDKDPFKPHVTEMLAALLDCFKDESWPVRDCACLALGHFVATFPEESQPVFAELCVLWFDHLSDNIQSIRENTAYSIGLVMRSELHGQEIKQKVKEHVKANLMKAKEQKSESQKFSGLQNVTQFGVAKASTEGHAHGQIEDKDAEDLAHQNNQLYSCGSLAPKLKRGGGCMDHGFSRPKEPWEMSDGSIFMIKEASACEDMHDFTVANLEGLSDLGYVDNFKHYHFMKQNLFRSLIKILENLGKKKFREFVEIFLDPTFRTAKALEHQGMALAAQDFILKLEKTYGQGIFKAILEGHDERYVADLQRYKEAIVGQPNQDFKHIPGNMPPSALGMGMGSGQGALAGKLNPNSIPNDILMTKAPWAK